jgi:regulator of extracellular matrix RemA (YlzA/DUF370 family)
MSLSIVLVAIVHLPAPFEPPHWVSGKLQVYRHLAFWAIDRLFKLVKPLNGILKRPHVIVDARSTASLEDAQKGRRSAPNIPSTDSSDIIRMQKETSWEAIVNLSNARPSTWTANRRLPNMMAFTIKRTTCLGSIPKRKGEHNGGRREMQVWTASTILGHSIPSISWAMGRRSITITLKNTHPHALTVAHAQYLMNTNP